MAAKQTFLSKYFLLIISALIFVFLAILVIFSNFSKEDLVKKYERLSGQEVTQINNEIKVTDSSSKEEIFLEITTPKENDVVSSSLLTVRGKTLPKADVFVNDKELKADSNGNFSTNITLDEGENMIVVVSNDDMGNYLEREFLVSLESF